MGRKKCDENKGRPLHGCASLAPLLVFLGQLFQKDLALAFQFVLAPFTVLARLGLVAVAALLLLVFFFVLLFVLVLFFVLFPVLVLGVDLVRIGGRLLGTASKF